MKFEVYEDKSGQWRWRAVASNGKIIADGAEAYKRQRNCLRSLRRLRWDAAQTPIVVIPFEGEQQTVEADDDDE